MVGRVDDPGEVRDEHGRAALGRRGDVGGRLRRREVQLGDEDEVVAGQVVARAHDVGHDAAPRERVVQALREQARVDVVRRVGVQPCGPRGRPVEQDRCAGVDPRAADLADGPQDLAEPDGPAPDVRVGPRVRVHRRVVLLGARARLAPLEEQERVGAVREVGERVAVRLGRRARPVVVLPVHGRRRVLHEHPRRPAGDRADEVGGEGQLALGVRVGRLDVVVVRDHVDARVRPLAGQVHPAGVVHLVGRAHHHEVGGARDVRRHLGEHAADVGVVGEQLVGGVALEVELLRRVGEGRRGARGEDLLELVVALGPERGPPRGVERLDRPVAALQPAAERVGGVVGVVERDVAADLVVDVPHRERRVRPVPLGDRPRHPQRVVAVDG